MTLVCKAGGRREIGERYIRRHQLTSCEVDSQFAQVVAHGPPAVLPEHAGQMYGVNTDCRGDHIVRQILGEPLMQEVSDRLEPRRRRLARR